MGLTPGLAESKAEPPPPKRRRTRWAQAEEQDADKAIVLFPDKVVLSNGMQVVRDMSWLNLCARKRSCFFNTNPASPLQVVIPPAISGRGDQEVLTLHRQVRADCLYQGRLGCWLCLWC